METDFCGAGYGKVRVCEGRAEDGSGGRWGGDNVAGIAARVVGKEDDGGYIGRCVYGVDDCQYVFACSREGHGIRTFIGEGGRDAESIGIGASKAIGDAGRSVVISLGAGEGGGRELYTHDGKEWREGIIY